MLSNGLASVRIIKADSVYIFQAILNSAPNGRWSAMILYGCEEVFRIGFPCINEKRFLVEIEYTGSPGEAEYLASVFEEGDEH